MTSTHSTPLASDALSTPALLADAKRDDASPTGASTALTNPITALPSGTTCADCGRTPALVIESGVARCGACYSLARAFASVQRSSWLHKDHAATTTEAH